MRPPPITRAKPAFAVRSSVLGTEYRVYVDASEKGAAKPAVVFVDGDYTFDWAVEAYRSLRAAGAVAPLVIAAVGYGKPFGDPGNRRGRDYTPDASAEEPESGGAETFLKVLTGPIWRELASRHRVREDRRAVGGHSLGGLFALYALLQATPFFTDAIVGAPSLWWAEGRFFGRVSELQAKRRMHPGRLFLGIGEEDSASMKAEFARLERQLAGRPIAGLSVAARRFAGRDHYDVATDLFRAGLASLFGG